MMLVPVTLKEARGFVGKHHRHNLPQVGHKFSVGLANDDEELIGIATASRPVGRHLDDGLTLEITRVATTGERNANSKLYGAISRAAFALGYRRLVTYTLVTESGSSLKASGWVEDLEYQSADPKGWESRMGRDQQDLFGNNRRPPEAKRRWWKYV